MRRHLFGILVSFIFVFPSLQAAERLAAPLPDGTFFTVKKETLVPIGTIADFKMPANNTFCSLFIDDFFGNDITLTPQTKIKITRSALLRGEVAFKSDGETYNVSSHFLPNNYVFPNPSRVMAQLLYDQEIVKYWVKVSCRVHGCEGAPAFISKYNNLDVSLVSYGLTIGDSAKPVPAHLECYKNPSNAELKWPKIGAESPKVKKMEALFLSDLDEIFDVHLPTPVHPN